MRRRLGTATGLTLALIFAAAAFAARADDAGWTLEDRDDDPTTGYALYQRRAPGAEFASWRIEAELAAPAELVARVTLANLVEGRRVPSGRRQHLLRREGDVFWIHTEIEIPMAADRDVVLRIERRRDPASGALRIDWKAVPEDGPPPAEGVVRMVVSEGFWEFRPTAKNRTHVRYENYAEPGGPFPAWLVDPMTSGQAVDGLEQLRGAVAEAAAELPPVAAQ